MKLTYIALARLPTGRAHGYAIMKMCEEFAQIGAEVELFVPTRRHCGNLGNQPFDYYRIKHTFTLHKLWATDQLGKYYKSRLAFLVDQVTFLFSVRFTGFGTTIVYTRDYQVALFVRSKNIVLEIHSIPEHTFLFLRGVARAYKIVVISNGLKSALIELGVAEGKILVAPDAVDLAEFTIDESRDAWKAYGVDPRKKIVLYTGHFYGWKGAETFAETSKILPPHVEVVLVGGGDSELASIKDKYPKAHVFAYQPRENIPQLLKSADILVLPNSATPKISSHYTSPLKLFQYMASGVPIVAADLPSVREILTDDNAFWFVPDDERSLATQIEFILSHPEQARMKAARAINDVQKYTWGERARAILAHINV